VERANRSILEKLRDMVFSCDLSKHSEAQWADLLPLAQRIINGSFHSAIGTSPATILFGGAIDVNRCLLSKMPAKVSIDVDTYVGQLQINQRKLIEAAEKHHENVCSKIMAKASDANRVKMNGRWTVKPAKEIKKDDWVLVKPSALAPKEKLGVRWFGPFVVLTVKGEIVSCVDVVSKRVRTFLKRNCELFDRSQCDSVEGMISVAEKDHFEYPIEAIIGHALIGDQGFGNGNIDQLPASHKRVAKKAGYQFLVKWYGRVEPSWQPFKHVCEFVHFPEYVARYPGLRMTD
jgi:hypothetical protein